MTKTEVKHITLLRDMYHAKQQTKQKTVTT